MNLYEGMFVLNNRTAKKDEDKALEIVTELIKRFGGEVTDARKWDERKLAYPLSKQTRGTYFLVHFQAPEDAVAKIEFQCNLNTEVLRQLIIVDEDGAEQEPELEEVAAAESTEPAKAEAVAKDKGE